jgi:HD-GYP domain-containing protein (c-di-GMP phosphodiesterase class II)/HAMP domain-containing protein
MPDARPTARRYPLYVHVTALFSALVLATAVALAWLGYAGSVAVAESATDQLFAGVARETRASLANALAPGGRFVDVLAQHPIIAARSLEERLQALPTLELAFAGDSAFAAVYVGYPDGSFFLLRPLRDDAARAQFSAPGTAAYLVDAIDVADGVRSPQLLFLDAQLKEIGRRANAESDFDPRNRPWYREAAATERRILTEPYVFFATGSPGMTAARRTRAASVVGLDVTLDKVASVLAATRPLPGAAMALFDGDGRVLATSDGNAGVVHRHADALDLARLEELPNGALATLARSPGEPATARVVEVEGREWKRSVLPIDTARGPVSLAVAVPRDELLADARRIRDRGLLGALGVLLAALPLTYFAARRVARALDRVSEQANDIREFRFDGPSAGPSPILEVDQLSAAMDRMRDTIRRFLEIATSLSAEKRFPALLDRVTRETATTVGAEGGAVYLLAADGRSLTCASLARSDGVPRASDHRVNIDAQSPLTEAFLWRRVAVAPQTAATASLPFVRELCPDEASTVIALPLVNRDREGLGVLALLVRGTVPPPAAQLAFAEALSGTAAVAIETQRLLEDRKALLDAFIRLVAGAIDAKSPYTGGHCQRVPELTLMLARAACEAKEGPFRDFRLSDEEWEALQIASWLHDCGKVTTPEYVVDKATKLETLYDRIHEVRMRFEVLKRDGEIACWKRIAAGEPRDACLARLSQEHAVLDEEFRFVAGCNEGGEFLDSARIERLRAIGARTWMRTLDDRLGVSHEERRRKERTLAPALPVAEPLLADKPEHLIEREPADALGDDNPQGFRMTVPRLKYNRGELANLAVSRGTLTEEERYVINHHIVQTIVMLSQLPFPKHLREVPEIAGGHHEKMDGTGYPKRLTREEMSWPARMMAIADIFEALTAADRPYKKGKTVSEALRIMSSMRRDQHIDPDLFDLFLASGVYREYAERFMRPEQIDAIDPAQFMS